MNQIIKNFKLKNCGSTRKGGKFTSILAPAEPTCPCTLMTDEAHELQPPQQLLLIIDPRLLVTGVWLCIFLPAPVEMAFPFQNQVPMYSTGAATHCMHVWQHKCCSHHLHIALHKEVLLKWGKARHLLHFASPAWEKKILMGCVGCSWSAEMCGKDRQGCSIATVLTLTSRETGHGLWLRSSTSTHTQIWDKSQWKHLSPPWSQIRVHLLWQHSFPSLFPQRQEWVSHCINDNRGKCWHSSRTWQLQLHLCDTINPEEQPVSTSSVIWPVLTHQRQLQFIVACSYTSHFGTDSPTLFLEGRREGWDSSFKWSRVTTAPHASRFI